MSDFSAYMEAKANKREAFAKYNSAGAHLELATIKERAAEFKSQGDPANRISATEGITTRDKMNAAIHYVLWGLLPDSIVHE